MLGRGVLVFTSTLLDELSQGWGVWQLRSLNFGTCMLCGYNIPTTKQLASETLHCEVWPPTVCPRHLRGKETEFLELHFRGSCRKYFLSFTRLYRFPFSLPRNDSPKEKVQRCRETVQAIGLGHLLIHPFGSEGHASAQEVSRVGTTFDVAPEEAHLPAIPAAPREGKCHDYYLRVEEAGCTALQALFTPCQPRSLLKTSPDCLPPIYVRIRCFNSGIWTSAGLNACTFWIWGYQRQVRDAYRAVLPRYNCSSVTPDLKLNSVLTEILKHTVNERGKHQCCQPPTSYQQSNSSPVPVNGSGEGTVSSVVMRLQGSSATVRFYCGFFLCRMSGQTALAFSLPTIAFLSIVSDTTPRDPRKFRLLSIPLSPCAGVTHGREELPVQ
ncbi:hypothetical protein J6590_033228 [Homalodisca vitripennis]|nr:hypothetical protein J6590_033228 [Homalodisca vitripennis]